LSETALCGLLTTGRCGAKRAVRRRYGATCDPNGQRPRPPTRRRASRRPAAAAGFRPSSRRCVAVGCNHRLRRRLKLPPDWAEIGDDLIATARDALGDAGLDQAFARGSSLTESDAIALAVDLARRAAAKMAAIG
jgi:hypothetical protein